jgi:zinc protease
MSRRLDRSLWKFPEWDLPVVDCTLENGLLVLVLPRRGTGVVVTDLYYPVGSFDEPPGLSGLAHFVEHMMFKGTERFPKGQIDRLVSAAAGQCNAETGEDSTHFWFAFPSDRWELALLIETDRMCGASFDSREVELERRVIAEERARELCSPLGRLEQVHWALAYLRHPYRNPILGWSDDALRIDPEELCTFYRTHYRPDGAVFVVVGDVEPARALRRIESAFANLRPGAEPRVRTEAAEPPQSGRREFRLADSESVSRGLLGWHTIPRSHADAPALDVLADILGCGRRSPLWRLLVEPDDSMDQAGLATWVEAGHAAAQRAGQLLIQVEADGDLEPAALEQRVVDEVARLANSGPTQEELARSRRRLESAWRWEHQELSSLAAGLGTAALWKDWKSWPAEHQAAMAVGADDICRVASRYLVTANLTVGWSLARSDVGHRAHDAAFQEQPIAAMPGDTFGLQEPALAGGACRRERPGAPDGPAPELSKRAAAHAPPATPAVPDFAMPALIPRLADYRPGRAVLANGLRLVYERRPGTGVVALELFTDAGCVREAKPGVAALTGRLLEEGTARRSAVELSEAIEGVGGMLEVGATGASVRVRAEDLDLAVELLADVMLRPSFPARAFRPVGRRLTAELEGDLDDPAFRADLSFRRLVYGSHALGRDPRGSALAIRQLTRPDVLSHHQRHFAPDSTILVADGDFEARKLVRLVKSRFGEWTPRGRALPRVPTVRRSRAARVRRIHRPGEQVQIVMGHLGISRRHPHYDALVILDHILGSGPGFCHRLGRIVRDELGLVYAIGGGMTDSADILPGLFRVYAGTTPEGVGRVVAAVTEQVQAMRSGAFSDEEVDRARSYLASAWVLEFQSVEQRAERLLELERFGLGFDEMKRWPERIAAITAAQVRKAARAHLRPDELCRVELGPIRHRGRTSQAECA